MSTSFTTIGEILVDFTPLARDSGLMGFRAHAGGSPANVAVGLARLGARVESAAHAIARARELLEEAHPHEPQKRPQITLSDLGIGATWREPES
jgi:hypothetical protein